MSELKHRLLSFAPSSGNRALLPAICVALMAGTAVLQLLLPQDNPLDAPLPARRAPRWTLPEIGAPANPAGAQGSSLFAPTRLAAPAGSGDDGEDSDGEAAKPKPVGPLDGAFVLGSVRIGSGLAVLIRSTDGRVMRLARGGSYHGWRLLAIGDTAATFRLGGKQREFEYGARAEASESGSDSEESSE
jgi:hypothetical protein